MTNNPDHHGTHREVELLETLRSLGGSARNAALAEAMGVSEETVRRTVKALAKAELVQRVHGGVYLSNGDGFGPVKSRMSRNASQKARIGAATAALIPDGASVFLDVGSTTAYVAERLRDHRGLTVVTNALTIAQTLAGRGGGRVFLAGGELREVELGSFGAAALEFIARFSIDFAVLSVDGIDMRDGYLMSGSAEAEMSRAVASHARRVIVVADNSKFSQSAPLVAFPAERPDILVTDAPLRPSFADRLARWDTDVVIAGDTADVQSGK